MSQMPARGDLEWNLLDRLHKAMRISGKSSGELAADLGVHRNTIGNYLNGRTAVDRRTLVAWAVSTGVPVEWLEHGTHATPEGTPPDGPAAPKKDPLAQLAARKKARHAGNGANHRYAA